jgi:hypothetical protein
VAGVGREGAGDGLVGSWRPGKGDYRSVLKKLGLAASAGSSGVGRERSPC